MLEGLLEAYWGHIGLKIFGAILGSGDSGAPSSSTGVCWEALGSSGGPVGLSWGTPGNIIEPSWADLGKLLGRSGLTEAREDKHAAIAHHPRLVRKCFLLGPFKSSAHLKLPWGQLRLSWGRPGLSSARSGPRLGLSEPTLDSPLASEDAPKGRGSGL